MSIVALGVVMANEGGGQLGGQHWPGKTAPGLEGLYGRLRIEVAGRPVGTLVVEGIYVALVPDVQGPADATVICADEETVGKLLRGQLNPFISSMQRVACLAGDSVSARWSGTVAKLIQLFAYVTPEAALQARNMDPMMSSYGF